MNQLGFCSSAFDQLKQYVLIGQAHDEDGAVAPLLLLPPTTTCCIASVQRVLGIYHRRNRRRPTSAPKPCPPQIGA
jgi:hypothetical protein